MEEADQTMCEKCMTINDINAPFCKRCGEPLPHYAPTRESRQQVAQEYATRANPPNEPPEQLAQEYAPRTKLPSEPRNTLDELMHLSFGELIGFGVRFGVVLAIAQIIALIVIVIIIIVVAVILTLLGVGIANLLSGHLTALAGV
jgi:hypothetical protein